MSVYFYTVYMHKHSVRVCNIQWIMWGHSWWQLRHLQQTSGTPSLYRTFCNCTRRCLGQSDTPAVPHAVLIAHLHIITDLSMWRETFRVSHWLKDPVKSSKRFFGVLAVLTSIAERSTGGCQKKLLTCCIHIKVLLNQVHQSFNQTKAGVLAVLVKLKVTSFDVARDIMIYHDFRLFHSKSWDEIPMHSWPGMFKQAQVLKKRTSWRITTYHNDHNAPGSEQSGTALGNDRDAARGRRLRSLPSVKQIHGRKSSDKNIKVFAPLPQFLAICGLAMFCLVLLVSTLRSFRL